MHRKRRPGSRAHQSVHSGQSSAGLESADGKTVRATLVAMLPHLDEPAHWAACHQVLTSAKTVLPALDEKERAAIVTEVEALIPRSIGARSFLFALTRSPRHAHQLLQEVCEASMPSVEMNFLYWQLAAIGFKNPGVFDTADEIRLSHYSRRLFERWSRVLSTDQAWVPPGQRNTNRVVVAVNQLLRDVLRHAPTRWALNISKTLQRDFGKQVLLVNTAGYPRVLPIPFFDPFVANFSDEFSAAGCLRYDDTEICFRQLSGPFESAAQFDQFLGTIAGFNPGFVLSLGGPNLAADLCSSFTTVVTVPSLRRFPVSSGTLFGVMQPASEADLLIQRALGIPDECVIPVDFADAIPERTKTISRAELGLPADAYVLAIVGNRLDHEITPEFCTALEGLLLSVPETFVAFVGEFRSYPTLAASSQCLRERSCSVPYQTDLRAFYMACDAFLNPPRQGGGTSAIWALAEGLPVFALGGDVAGNVGKPFVFESFTDIAAEIKRCLKDASHRADLARQALARANELTDVRVAVGRMLKHIEARLELRAPAIRL
jgi:hypothetical protein